MYGNAAMCPFLKKGGTGELEDSPDHGSESDPEFAKCLPLARRTEVIIPHLLQPVLVNSRPVLAHQKPAIEGGGSCRGPIQYAFLHNMSGINNRPLLTVNHNVYLCCPSPMRVVAVNDCPHQRRAIDSHDFYSVSPLENIRWIGCKRNYLNLVPELIFFVVG